MGTGDAEREEALRRLPAAYAVALRLRAAGIPEELIVQCLDIEPAALGPLMQIAEAKFTALLRQESRQ